ncbi:substrate-binding periplasmic protein [Faecalicoccus acidiformans]|uniref:Amino acid ABC transporter substrate-binding protein n=1 Tax=Faecalicoccus acidiformans TaxID=915173 RepID=A0ABS2FPD2_9FIRM|nr:ABC transporter substrate-binding protein [Faecalicoccus acidiformans]MBM6831903.1 amino acid ABC transporter substrate-binding protein [Faecalicoccus acidiformans]
MTSKFLKMGLAAAMAMGVVGCSSSAPAEETEDQTVITIGISPDYEPYESLNTDNEMVGFDIDMVAWFEDYLNENEDISYKFEFKQMDFDNIVTQIQGDQIDLGISGFTYEESRKVEWSEPYLGSAQVAVVPKGSDITSIDQLSGKSIAAQTGATGEQAAADAGGEVTGLKNVQDIMNALSANQYDAAVIDSGVAKAYEESGNFTVLDGVLMDEKNYIIAKEGNTEMIDLINQCIEAFIASEDYQAMCEEYGLTAVE